MEFLDYAPSEFLNAVIGHNEKKTEVWRHTRFMAWATLIAKNVDPAKFNSPKDLLKLPGDDVARKIDKKEFEEIFKIVKEKWTQP